MKNKDLDSFLEKLVEEKSREREALLREAEEKKRQILKDIENEAHTQFKLWLKNSQDAFLREKQAELFDLKQENRGKILNIKREIIEEAFRRLRDFIKKNPTLLPKKEIVTKEGKQVVTVDEEEIVEFLKERFCGDFDNFFRDEGD